jgi:hypothetical protein
MNLLCVQRQVIADLEKYKTVTTGKKLLRTQYKKWMAKLRDDQKAVKEPPNHSQRNRIAAKKVTLYLGYLRDWFAIGNRHQNDVLTQCVVWAVDGNRWDVLLELADPAIADPNVGNLHWMKRPLVDFVSEEVLKIADNAKKAGQSITDIPIVEILQRIESDAWKVGQIKDGEWISNHVLIARYHRFCGILSEEQGDMKVSAIHYAKAHHAYPQVGVKTKLGEVLEHLMIKRDREDGKIHSLNSLLEAIG